MFDLAIIQSVYRRYETVISQLRRLAKRPLTLTEKILYTHFLLSKKMWAVSSVGRAIPF